MGLDTTLYKQKVKPELEQVYNKLVEEEEKYEEVLYWRKNHELLNWFDSVLGGVENCEYHEVSEEVFVRWLQALEYKTLEYYEDDNEEDWAKEILDRDIKMITKILKETDFKTTKFFFHNWW